jgi:CDGSH-type Zn-finger protein
MLRTASSKFRGVQKYVRRHCSSKANNYGIPSNVPVEQPTRRADGVDMGVIRDMIEESAEMEVKVCRCFLSATFPYCDGAHVQHNEKTGDNAAPLVVKRGHGGTIDIVTMATFDDDEKGREVPGPRANNYGVPSNVPPNSPERRLDVRNNRLQRSRLVHMSIYICR